MTDIDEDCNPNKTCKNMKDVTYELTPEKWREMLKKDNKYVSEVSR